MSSLPLEVLELCLEHLGVTDFNSYCAASKHAYKDCFIGLKPGIVKQLLHRSVFGAPKSFIHLEREIHPKSPPITKEAKDVEILISHCIRMWGIVPLASRLDLQGALVKATGDPALCWLLISAGARVTTDLIITTARSTFGPQQWIQIHAELGIAAAAIPQQLRALCLYVYAPPQQAQLQHLTADEFYTLICVACTWPGPKYSRTDWIIQNAPQLQQITPAQVVHLIQLALAASTSQPHGQALSFSRRLHLLLQLEREQELRMKYKLQALEACISHGVDLHNFAVYLLNQKLTPAETILLLKYGLQGPAPWNATDTLLIGNPPAAARAMHGVPRGLPGGYGSRNLPAAGMKELLGSFLGLQDYHAADEVEQVLQTFLDLPAAKELTAADAMELLLLASKRCSSAYSFPTPPAFQALLNGLLPKVTHPDAAAAVWDAVCSNNSNNSSNSTFSSLFSLASAADSIDMQHWLLQMPQTQQQLATGTGVTELLQLVEPALRAGKQGALVLKLLQCPCAKHVPGDKVLALTRAALLGREVEVLAALLNLAAGYGHGFLHISVLHLLQEGIGLRAWSSMEWLRNHPDAALLSRAELCSLLRTAVLTRGAGIAVTWLLQLVPAAANELAPAEVQELLQEALAPGKDTAFSALVQLSCSEKLTSSNLQQLLSLKRAAQGELAQILEPLLQLEGAKGIGVGELHVIVLAAMAAGVVDVPAWRSVRSLPSAQAWSSGQVALLLQSAVAALAGMFEAYVVQQLLASFRAVEHLKAEQLQGLLLSTLTASISDQQDQQGDSWGRSGALSGVKAHPAHARVTSSEQAEEFRAVFKVGTVPYVWCWGSCCSCQQPCSWESSSCLNCWSQPSKLGRNVQ